LSLFLGACSATGKRQGGGCLPVPESWTQVPAKPTAENIAPGESSNRDVAGKIYALDQWGEKMAGQLEDIERHQAPCRGS